MIKKAIPVPEQRHEPLSIKTENLPPSFKMGRDAALQLSKAEGDIFTDMKKEGRGVYIITEIRKVVNELDLACFSLAVCQILYNQSFQSGTIETNSGRSNEIDNDATEELGYTQYKAYITTSLNDLCRLAYGVDAPDFRQKKAMWTLIEALDKTPVVIPFPNGDKLEKKLCTIDSKYTRKEDGAVYYHLLLHSIFCSNVMDNFGELPQDITKRLSQVTKKKTAAHLRLLRLLSIQTKNRPFVRKMDELLKELNLHEAHKKDRRRTENQLISIFDSMKAMNVIDKYKIEYTTTRAKKVIDKVTFYLSSREKLLCKSGEEPEEEQTSGAC